LRRRGRPARDRRRDGPGRRARGDPGSHWDHAGGGPGDHARAPRPRGGLAGRAPGRGGRLRERGRRGRPDVSRLATLDREIFDAVVVGGGMAGAGVARDLAQRGLSCVLVEKVDFAAGTTSRSSKLIHGGLRYLELFDFRLVRESLRGGETLARLAPHLIRPLPFLMPVYRDGPRSLIKVRLGLRLYDLLSPRKRTPRYGMLDAAQARALEPTLRPEELLGAGYYFDD